MRPVQTIDMTPPAKVEEAAGTYLQAFARYWYVVLGSMVLATVAGLYSISKTGHTYEASASVLVSPLAAADPIFTGTGVISDTGDPARTIQTAAALINSRRAAMATADAMGAGWTEGSVRAAVGVAPRGQSNVLAVTGRASTAEAASQLANSYARSALKARATVVRTNISAKLSALEARLARASATSERQELATRIVQLETVRASGVDPTLQIVQEATPPGAPTGASKLMLAVLSALVGFAIGSVAAVALAFFSPRIADLREVETLLPVPVLAGVPKVAYSHRRYGLGPASMPPFAFEHIRMLRAQVPRSNESSIIMVTSADSGDGKTTVTAGLAAAFAEGKQDVILLDLDLRRPKISDIFGVKRAVGRPLQLESPTLEEMLEPVPDYPSLKILSARAGNIDVFERFVNRLPALLTEARGLAKWIILDTPPIAEVSDALRFAPECDAVILVVRPQHTDRSHLILAYNQLMRVGAQIIGTVVNDNRGSPKFGTYFTQHQGFLPLEQEPPQQLPRARWQPEGSAATRSASAD